MLINWLVAEKKPTGRGKVMWSLTQLVHVVITVCRASRSSSNVHLSFIDRKYALSFETCK